MQTPKMIGRHEGEALSGTDGGTLSPDVFSFGGRLPRGEFQL
jgi:hypothetical protein